MAMKIRLARGGSKKRPFYRVVAADSRMPRDGRYVEKLGTYNPLLAKDSEERVQLNMERVNYWLSQGAAAPAAEEAPEAPVAEEPAEAPVSEEAAEENAAE